MLSGKQSSEFSGYQMGYEFLLNKQVVATSLQLHNNGFNLFSDNDQLKLV